MTRSILSKAAMTPLQMQCNVLRALMLRDIRTRFFGHGLGYLIAIGWPLAHIVILLVLYNVTQRVAPIGSSLTLYFATSLAPVMAFIYGSRWIMFSAVTNKTLLSFPLVKVFDVLLARALLETAASCCMVLALLGSLTALGIDVRPASAPEAMKAMAAAILLGTGLGFINGLVALVFPFWATGYSLIIIALYITSGVLFIPDQLPEVGRVVISWNPLVHTVEWMREAYYGVHSRTLDKVYLVSFGAGTMFLALAALRFGRRFLLRG